MRGWEKLAEDIKIPVINDSYHNKIEKPSFICQALPEIRSRPTLEALFHNI